MSKEISTLHNLVDYYLHSPQFLALRGRTQKDYEYSLGQAMQTQITPTKTLGDIKLNNLGVSECKMAYQQWVTKGVRMANVMAMVTSLVLNIGEELELIVRNPMRSVKKMVEGQRKVMWSTNQVRAFLDTAYGEYKWRSIGLIVHMAYEFAQRVGDMRCLKWDNINFETQRLDLEQSKKRAEVHLPIEDNLFSMLQKQHEDFSFQEYVAPHPQPRSGTYKIYHLNEVSRMVNQVKQSAGLPKELTAMDMRRTAITEMVEAGVDTTQIMAVSGHNSPNSMKPYIKHTFNSANNALSKRESYKNA
tara:strand:+ start:52 stop:960 length:909 start_codon:yes stop_codon:yes gene_type:complete